MIVIDAYRGGSDSGNKGNDIVEKDYTLLISKYIYDRLKELGANVTLTRSGDETLSDSKRAEIVKNAYGDNSKVVALSNRLNVGGGDGAEIIYALRNNDTLASSIAENLVKAGRNVDKWYQRRSLSDTSKDYYPLQRDTGNIETIIIYYGFVDNKNDATKIKDNYEKYAEAVVKAIANYKGIPYYSKEGIEETYVVKKGDSLWNIANKYNITVNDLKNANNLSSNLLNIGDVLVIPTNKPEESVDVTESTYKVQKGDSLWSIAKKFGTTVDSLKKLNNLASNTLSIGQILIISEQKTPSDIDEATYVVKKGDSLWVIANKYRTTVDEIKKLNNLSSNTLSIGQVLKIPSANIYIVQKGDSLWSIANKNGTTVTDIKKKNNLSSNLLSVGQQLII